MAKHNLPEAGDTLIYPPQGEGWPYVAIHLKRGSTTHAGLGKNAAGARRNLAGVPAKLAREKAKRKKELAELRERCEGWREEARIARAALAARGISLPQARRLAAQEGDGNEVPDR